MVWRWRWTWRLETYLFGGVVRPGNWDTWRRVRCKKQGRIWEDKCALFGEFCFSSFFIVLLLKPISTEFHTSVEYHDGRMWKVRRRKRICTSTSGCLRQTYNLNRHSPSLSAYEHAVLQNIIAINYLDALLPRYSLNNREFHQWMRNL